MKKQTLLVPVAAALLLLAITVSVKADNKQVVTVGQQQLTETVTRLTFDGDQVVLYMANGQTQTVDMEDVTIVFTVIDALKALETEAKEAPLAYYDLSGRQLKKAPKKGTYIMKKGKKLVKVVK